MTGSKYKVVFNHKVAGALCDRGFRVLDVQPNRDRPWVKVYFFEETDELLAALNQIWEEQSEVGRID